MSQAWGARGTDYITKTEGMCDKCRQPCPCKNDPYFRYGYTCAADYEIKYCYSQGMPQDAIELLRDMPSELLKDYLPEERRTPTELKAVILDELQAREKEDTPRL